MSFTRPAWTTAQARARTTANPRTSAGSAGISGSIRSHIASEITNRTDTSDQLTNRSKRHAFSAVALARVPMSRR